MSAWRTLSIHVMLFCLRSFPLLNHACVQLLSHTRKRGEERRKMDSGSDSLQDKVPSLIDAALDDLQRGLSRKQFTSAQLAQAYKARIAEVNSIFNDVVDINPDAETTARELDRERQEKGPRR